MARLGSFNSGIDSLSRDAKPNTADESIESGEVTFHALGLDDHGAVVPIMNSGEGFALLFGDPDQATLNSAANLLLRPFPAGLITPAGMLVANPAYVSPSLQGLFTRNAYHRTVIWSWLQALFAAGLELQLRRVDLSPSLRNALANAQSALWTVIEKNRNLRNSELWSWTIDGQQLIAIPFGSASADVDESNAAQLWSTVYLAVHPPVR